MVIVNRNSAVSRAIGAYYARRRGLLSENLCLIATPEREEISRDIYNRQIEMPVGAFLKSRRLVERTLYLVTTLGVPLKIQGSSGSAGTAASVDSELTLLYGKLKGKSVPVTGSALNPFYAQRDAPFGHPRFPIYLVTRLAAYDLASVKGMIDRSLEARNHGRFVLDLKSEDDQPGNSWLRTAAILLPADRVVIDETPAVLYDQRDVIGYGSWGSNDKGRERRRLGFQWLPGAIATEFVSTDGRTFHRPPPAWTFGTWEDHSSWFAGSPQSLTADFIAEGATGASGHVYEPYLMATPRPQYLFPAYYSGRNLADLGDKTTKTC